MVCCMEQVDLVCRADIQRPVRGLAQDRFRHAQAGGYGGPVPAQPCGAVGKRQYPAGHNIVHPPGRRAQYVRWGNRRSGRAFPAPGCGPGQPVSIANSAGILHWPSTHGAWKPPRPDALRRIAFPATPGKCRAPGTGDDAAIRGNRDAKNQCRRIGGLREQVGCGSGLPSLQRSVSVTVTAIRGARSMAHRCCSTATGRALPAVYPWT